jgi:hypothetical protein
MAARTLPPAGRNGNGPVIGILHIEPMIAGLLVGTDPESGLVVIQLAQNRRASLSMGVENALALAQKLVAAVGELGRGGRFRR